MCGTELTAGRGGVAVPYLDRAVNMKHCLHLTSQKTERKRRREQQAGLNAQMIGKYKS